MVVAAGERVAPVHGLPCWVNLMVGDLDIAQAFYSAVLGWTFSTSALGDQFLVASADGRPVASVSERHPGVAPASAWTPYFAVDDAAAAAARIRERGATLAVGPITLGEGRIGLAADPAGATFGFYEGMAPPWAVGQQSAPVRLDLQTSDVFDAALFYGNVFAWDERRGIDAVYRHDHVLVRHHGQPVLSLQGGRLQASQEASLQPRWLVGFAVDNVERAVTAAVTAGGSKHKPAAPWRPNGFSRTLQDPDGGLFTLTRQEA